LAAEYCALSQRKSVDTLLLKQGLIFKTADRIPSSPHAWRKELSGEVRALRPEPSEDALAANKRRVGF
jgi:hypothetical protein